MLYAHVADAKNAGSEPDRSEYGEIGLGAVVPHAANLQSTVSQGSGGYSVAGTGGQPAGQPGGGAVPVAGTAGYGTVGRTTSPISNLKKDAAKSAGRNVFQATAQGSRVSMGKEAVPTAVKGQAGKNDSGFPVGGLYGFFSNISAPTPIFAPSVAASKAALKSKYGITNGNAIPDNEPGLGGFLGVDWGRYTNIHTYLPPGGKINRIQPLGFLAKVLPTPIRKVIRYTGAGITSPFTTGGQLRRIYGLSPGESSTFQTIGLATRYALGVIAAAATGGYAMNYAAGTYGSGAAVAGGEGAVAGAGAGAGGVIGYTPGMAVGTTVPAGAPVVGAGQAGFSAAAWTPAAMPATSGIPSIGVVTGVTAASPLGFTAAGVPVQAGSVSWMAAHPVTSAVAGAVGQTALTVAAQKILQPPQYGPQPQGGYESGGTVVDMGGAGQPQPQNPPIILGGGGSVGGATGEPAPSEILAGASLPMIVAGGAIMFAIGYKLLKRKS